MERICYGCFAQSTGSGACPCCGYDPREDAGKYPTALRPGTVLNQRYTLGRVLGQGGFGITYTAQDFSTGERVAVKEYLPSAISVREATGQVSSVGSQGQENFEHGRDGFMEEANALVDFSDNPNVVNIYDFFEQNGTAYFVMEYVQGINLKSYVKMMGGKLGEDAANRILLPIMDALVEIHSRNLVHRDIAPDNIIVTAGDSAKLIDFGAARYSTGEKSLSLDVVLKHGYAPIEQYSRRGRQGAFTDVYAMAATYYYAVTGRVPPDSVERMVDDSLEPPSALGVKLSPHIEKALMTALEVQYMNRYRSMADFAAAIRGEAPQAPVAPAVAEAEPIIAEMPAAPAMKGLKRKPVIFAAVAALLLVLVLLLTLPGKKDDSGAVVSIPSNTNSAAAEMSWEFDNTSGQLTIYGSGPMESDAQWNWATFRGNIKTVVVSEGITHISDGAFSDCRNLKAVSLPQSLEYIGQNAFVDCVYLENLVLPEGLKSIGQGAFQGCSWLAKAELPDSVTEIGSFAFKNCSKLEAIQLPESLELLGGQTFYGCERLAELSLPQSLKTIPIKCFYGCGLSSVTLHAGITSIGDGAFGGCKELCDVYYVGSREQWEAIEIAPNNFTNATIHYR